MCILFNVCVVSTSLMQRGACLGEEEEVEPGGAGGGGGVGAGVIGWRLFFNN